MLAHEPPRSQEKSWRIQPTIQRLVPQRSTRLASLQKQSSGTAQQQFESSFDDVLQLEVQHFSRLQQITPVDYNSLRNTADQHEPDKLSIVSS